MPFLSLTRIPDGLGFQRGSKLRQVFEAAKIVRVVLFPRARELQMLLSSKKKKEKKCWHCQFLRSLPAAYQSTGLLFLRSFFFSEKILSSFFLHLINLLPKPKLYPATAPPITPTGAHHLQCLNQALLPEYVSLSFIFLQFRPI